MILIYLVPIFLIASHSCIACGSSFPSDPELVQEISSNPLTNGSFQSSSHLITPNGSDVAHKIAPSENDGSSSSDFDVKEYLRKSTDKQLEHSNPSQTAETLALKLNLKNESTDHGKTKSKNKTHPYEDVDKASAIYLHVKPVPPASFPTTNSFEISAASREPKLLGPQPMLNTGPKSLQSYPPPYQIRHQKCKPDSHHRSCTALVALGRSKRKVANSMFQPVSSGEPRRLSRALTSLFVMEPGSELGLNDRPNLAKGKYDYCQKFPDIKIRLARDITSVDSGSFTEDERFRIKVALLAKSFEILRQKCSDELSEPNREYDSSPSESIQASENGLHETDPNSLDNYPSKDVEFHSDRIVQALEKSLEEMDQSSKQKFLAENMKLRSEQDTVQKAENILDETDRNPEENLSPEDIPFHPQRVIEAPESNSVETDPDLKDTFPEKEDDFNSQPVLEALENSLEEMDPKSKQKLLAQTMQLFSVQDRMQTTENILDDSIPEENVSAKDTQFHSEQVAQALENNMEELDSISKQNVLPVKDIQFLHNSLEENNPNLKQSSSAQNMQLLSEQDTMQTTENILDETAPIPEDNLSSKRMRFDPKDILQAIENSLKDFNPISKLNSLAKNMHLLSEQDTKQTPEHMVDEADPNPEQNLSANDSQGVIQITEINLDGTHPNSKVEFPSENKQLSSKHSKFQDSESSLGKNNPNSEENLSGVVDKSYPAEQTTSYVTKNNLEPASFDFKESLLGKDAQTLLEGNANVLTKDLKPLARLEANITTYLAATALQNRGSFDPNSKEHSSVKNRELSSKTDVDNAPENDTQVTHLNSKENLRMDSVQLFHNPTLGNASETSTESIGLDSKEDSTLKSRRFDSEQEAVLPDSIFGNVSETNNQSTGFDLKEVLTPKDAQLAAQLEIAEAPENNTKSDSEEHLSTNIVKIDTVENTILSSGNCSNPEENVASLINDTERNSSNSSNHSNESAMGHLPEKEPENDIADHEESQPSPIPEGHDESMAMEEGNKVAAEDGTDDLFWTSSSSTSEEQEEEMSTTGTDYFHLELPEICHLIKTNPNVRAFILNKLILYVPMLICDVLIWMVIVKLVRHIRRHLAQNDEKKVKCDEDGLRRDVRSNLYKTLVSQPSSPKSEQSADSGESVPPPPPPP